MLNRFRIIKVRLMIRKSPEGVGSQTGVARMGGGVSIFSKFSYFDPDPAHRRNLNAQIESVERVFGEKIQVLRKLFPLGEYELDETDYQDPQDKSLIDIGVNALVHTEEMSCEQFPLLIHLLKRGREEVRFRHFERKWGGITCLAMLATEDRFSGKTARILTNDIELLKSIASARFHPLPPWIVWYELGPSSAIERQGDPDFWFSYVWDRFWNNLSLPVQARYVADWRERTRSYITDEEWEEWVFLVRMRDPKYRDSEDG